MWDEFILPMMNCSESDKSDIQVSTSYVVSCQSVEKNVKSALSKLEDQVKKAKKEAKAAKKGNDAPEVIRMQQEFTFKVVNTVKKVLTKHQMISRYFQSYKELRFSFWLRKYYSFVEAQIKYHSRVSDLLTQESVAKAVKTDPTPLPFPNIELDAVYPKYEPF